MSSTDNQPGPYAACVTCDEHLSDREAMDAHMDATLEVSTEGRSHQVRVVNPTPEERAKSRASVLVALAVGDAIERCMDGLYSDVRSGTIPASDVVEALNSNPDIADAWDDYARVNGL